MLEAFGTWLAVALPYEGSKVVDDLDQVVPIKADWVSDFFLVPLPDVKVFSKQEVQVLVAEQPRFRQTRNLRESSTKSVVFVRGLGAIREHHVVGHLLRRDERLDLRYLLPQLRLEIFL